MQVGPSRIYDVFVFTGVQKVNTIDKKLFLGTLCKVKKIKWVDNC